MEQEKYFARNAIVVTYGDDSGLVKLKEWKTPERKNEKTTIISDIPVFVARIIARRYRDKKGFTMIDYSRKPVEISGQSENEVNKIAESVSNYNVARVVKLVI